MNKKNETIVYISILIQIIFLLLFFLNLNSNKFYETIVNILWIVSIFTGILLIFKKFIFFNNKNYKSKFTIIISNISIILSMFLTVFYVLGTWLDKM